jgi:hypothetical protein
VLQGVRKFFNRVMYVTPPETVRVLLQINTHFMPYHVVFITLVFHKFFELNMGSFTLQIDLDNSDNFYDPTLSLILRFNCIVIYSIVINITLLMHFHGVCIIRK